MQANCIRCEKIFSDLGHSVKFEVIEGAQHEYDIVKENDIYMFFLSQIK